MFSIIYLLQNILFILIIIGIFRLIFGKAIREYHSNWSTLIDGFKYSSEDFYDKVKKELLSKEIQGISTTYIYRNIGGLTSGQRKYLRVMWKEYEYDICASPFGTGFFISWWLLTKDSLANRLIKRIPFVGNFLADKLYPKTYYKIDTASMFMTYANATVQKIIKDILNEKGVRALTELEKQPVLNNIFKR
ncbi:hypothetical protein H2O64_21600 [Kordia sp. YSTF-M3]|uniref:Uncharacterized protein n=1 Tax=Kordia aestuariivivens TaxID=2759037 RepID=A0ABR7QFD0_9FLAO|nr:hypothetical protein [Kordia aestuariivivens]MBC8757280.1 hypothetical protein [Kordia aestuariivivens]